jgi:hypothetical protein
MEFFLLRDWQVRRRTAEKSALLSQRVSEQFELSCGFAEEVPFGRWLRNEAVTVEELHEPCGKDIANRAAGRHVLAIEDTTALSYQRHARCTRGLGPAGNGTQVGLFLHPALPIDAENGDCPGLIGAQVYVRHEGATVDHHMRLIEEKESYRWLKGVETADQVLKEPAHLTRVQARRRHLPAVRDAAGGPLGPSDPHRARPQVSPPEQRVASCDWFALATAGCLRPLATSPNPARSNSSPPFNSSMKAGAAEKSPSPRHHRLGRLDHRASRRLEKLQQVGKPAWRPYHAARSRPIRPHLAWLYPRKELFIEA